MALHVLYVPMHTLLTRDLYIHMCQLCPKGVTNVSNSCPTIAQSVSNSSPQLLLLLLLLSLLLCATAADCGAPCCSEYSACSTGANAANRLLLPLLCFCACCLLLLRPFRPNSHPSDSLRLPRLRTDALTGGRLDGRSSLTASAGNPCCGVRLRRIASTGYSSCGRNMCPSRSSSAPRWASGSYCGNDCRLCYRHGRRALYRVRRHRHHAAATP